MSKEFIPKTRLQVYKAWANLGLHSIVPEKYLVEETTVIIDNKELSFSANGNNYAAELANSTVVIYPNDVVKYNGVEISQMVAGHTYNTGDVYYQIFSTGGLLGLYNGAKIVSVGVEPTGTNHASVYRSTTRIKLAPKTNIEKYYAYKAGLYDGELPDPKTVDEKLECKLCSPLADVGDIAPKTRSQWYRAKALELVEDVPSKEKQVALAEDVAVTWTADTDPGKYYCNIYEQEGPFRGPENIIVTINGNEIPYSEDRIDEPLYWEFKSVSKTVTGIRVSYYSESDPPANSVASVYLIEEELLIPPKTNIEKYYAYKAGLYDGELPDPKTVDEYILAIDAGWEPAVPDEESIGGDSK